MRKISSTSNQPTTASSFLLRCFPIPCVKVKKEKSKKQNSIMSNASSFNDEGREYAKTQSVKKDTPSTSFLRSFLKEKIRSFQLRHGTDEDNDDTSLPKKEYSHLSLEELEKEINLLKEGIKAITGLDLPIRLNSGGLNIVLKNYLTRNIDTNSDSDSEGVIFLDKPRNKDAKEFLENFEKETNSKIDPGAISEYLELYAGCKELISVNNLFGRKATFPKPQNTSDIAENILNNENIYNIFEKLYQKYSDKDKNPITPKDDKETLVTKIANFLKNNPEEATEFYTLIEIENLKKQTFGNLIPKSDNKEHKAFTSEEATEFYILIEIENLKKQTFGNLIPKASSEKHKAFTANDIANEIQNKSALFNIFKIITDKYKIKTGLNIKVKPQTFDELDIIEAFLNLETQGYESYEEKFQLLHANKAFFEAVKEFQSSGKYPPQNSSSDIHEKTESESDSFARSSSFKAEPLAIPSFSNPSGETSVREPIPSDAHEAATTVKEMVRIKKETTGESSHSKGGTEVSSVSVKATREKLTIIEAEIRKETETSVPLTPLEQGASRSLENKKKVTFKETSPSSSSQDISQTISGQDNVTKIRKYREGIFRNASAHDITQKIFQDKNQKNIILSLYHKENPNTYESDTDIIQKVIYKPEIYPQINLKFYATLAHIKQAEALKIPKTLAKIKQLANDSYKKVSNETTNIYQNLLQSSNDMALFNQEDFHSRLNFLDTPQSIEIYIDNIYNLQTAEAPSDIFPNNKGNASEQTFSPEISINETATSHPIQDSSTSTSLATPITAPQDIQTSEASLEIAISHPLTKQKSISLPIFKSLPIVTNLSCIPNIFVSPLQNTGFASNSKNKGLDSQWLDSSGLRKTKNEIKWSSDDETNTFPTRTKLKRSETFPLRKLEHPATHIEETGKLVPLTGSKGTPKSWGEIPQELFNITPPLPLPSFERDETEEVDSDDDITKTLKEMQARVSQKTTQEIYTKFVVEKTHYSIEITGTTEPFIYQPTLTNEAIESDEEQKKMNISTDINRFERLLNNLYDYKKSKQEAYDLIVSVDDKSRQTLPRHYENNMQNEELSQNTLKAIIERSNLQNQLHDFVIDFVKKYYDGNINHHDLNGILELTQNKTQAQKIEEFLRKHIKNIIEIDPSEKLENAFDVIHVVDIIDTQKNYSSLKKDIEKLETYLDRIENCFKNSLPNLVEEKLFYKTIAPVFYAVHTIETEHSWDIQKQAIDKIISHNPDNNYILSTFQKNIQTEMYDIMHKTANAKIQDKIERMKHNLSSDPQSVAKATAEFFTFLIENSQFAETIYKNVPKIISENTAIFNNTELKDVLKKYLHNNSHSLDKITLENISKNLENPHAKQEFLLSISKPVVMNNHAPFTSIHITQSIRNDQTNTEETLEPKQVSGLHYTGDNTQGHVILEALKEFLEEKNKGKNKLTV